MTVVLRSRDALKETLASLQGKSIGLVPTMGFLHEGHLSLMRQARKDNEVVITSIFVNPTQFGPNEDLDRYPRDPDGDIEKCRRAGVDYIWMPDVSTVYAENHSTTVHVEGLTNSLCGASRPGHFDGVTTVVAKLFNSTRADRAYFGEKDFQQLAVIRRMVRDLDMPVDVIGMPIVRDPDGLALSSRNKYLDASHRADGLRLSQALEAARQGWEAGERDANALIRTMREHIEGGTHVDIDYIELVDADTLLPHADQATERPVAVLAVRVGSTRLIDNARLDRKARVI